MRAFKRYGNRGFTLVELMIVIAIIGVLAVMAMMGYNQVMARARTAEAKQSLGDISKAAATAHSRNITTSQLLVPGQQSNGPANGLCASAVPVPQGSPPPKKKYQPNNTGGLDFDQGDAVTGWKCLGFEISDPIHYQYNYVSGSGYVGPAAGGGPDPGAAGFEAAARGDLDGDGIFSTFTLTGTIDPTTKNLIRATEVYVNEESE